MIGKLVLLPLDRVYSGMQAVCTDPFSMIKGVVKVMNIWGEGRIEVYKKHISGGGIGAAIEFKHLKQIAVEWTECCSETGYQECKGAHAICTPIIKTLPLSLSDWKWAINHIGEEINFFMKNRE